MRLGMLRVRSRTAKSLSYAAAALTVLIFFMGFCLLLSFAISPDGQEAHWRLWGSH